MTDEDFEDFEPNEAICLPVHFKSLAEAESVYRADISRGGIFVATTEPLALREQVEVEFSLEECSPSLRVEGEVVRRVTEEDARAPGVAVAFTQPMEELRPAFESLLETGNEPAETGLSTDTIFVVASEGQGGSLAEGDPLSLSLVDLAASGLSLGRMLEVIPESESEIRSRLDALVESGTLLLR